MSISIHPANKKITILVISLVVIGCLSAFALAAYRNQPSALAAVKEDWSAGNIISDTAFTDKDSMSVSDIQAFLDSKITCDIWGTGKATEFGSSLTRAQYAASRGWAAPPYTCLNRYYEVPKILPGGNMPANNYSNPTSIPSGAQSAAWIIKDAANRYNISPKVLLVKIATESVGPLTSDNWPLFSQYRYAMGSHCPDSGPGGSANCDTAYAGFSIQMYSAAELMRWYLDSMDQSWWTYKKPGVNYVLWNVTQRGCGGANITIQGKATAALYTYTPYQPNQAALNNMYGTGDNCSAYGNRNFWRVYWDWFGDTRSTPRFESLVTPRRFELNENTQKVNATITSTVGGTLEKGLVRKYTDGIVLSNGEQCLRTETDKKLGNNLCIPYRYLKEITLTYQDIPVAEQVKQIGSTGYKVDLIRNLKVSENYPSTRQITFTKKITIEDILYYISEVDVKNGIKVGIPATQLEDSAKFEPITPTRMQTIRTAYKKLASNQQNVDQALPSYTTRIFVSRALVNNVWHYRTEVDEKDLLGKALSTNDITGNLLQPFVEPRCMITTESSIFEDIRTGKKTSSALPINTAFKFTHKVITDSGTVYQTDRDHSLGNSLAIPNTHLKDTPCYEAFAKPRELRLSKDAYKVNPVTGATDRLFSRGLTRKYTSKIYINGKWFYRTEVDTISGTNLAFPASALGDL